MAHKLSTSSLSPSNIQRSSAKLALSVFHDSTFAALQYYSTHEKKPWSDTAIFIDMINRLWKLVNVKSSDVGIRKLKKKIFSSHDEHLKFFSKWFSCWHESKLLGLTWQTSVALQLLCTSLHDITVHLLDVVGFQYVLGNWSYSK